MSKIIFEEKQRFNQWYIYLMIFAALGVVAYTGYGEYQENQDAGAFISLLIFAPFILFIFFVQLRTRIDEQGIQVQFFPIHLKPIRYTWTELYSAKVESYSPIGEYGGYGYRVSFRGKGKAFNIRGNQGIRIQTDEGKIRMIGTQNPEKAQAAIEQYLAPKS